MNMTFEEINRKADELRQRTRDQLLKAGLTVDGNRFNGIYIPIDYRPQQRKKKSFGQGKYNGKWTIVVGVYGNKKPFHQLANGGFNWDKIVEDIKHRVDLEKVRQKTKAKMKSDGVLIDQLKEQFNLNKFDRSIKTNIHGGFNMEIWSDDLHKLSILLSVAIQLGLVKTNEGSN